MAFDCSGTANYHTKTIPALGSTLSYFAHFNPDALGVMRAFMGLVLDELNTLRALHALPARTFAQLKTAIRNRLGS